MRGLPVRDFEFRKPIHTLVPCNERELLLEALQMARPRFVLQTRHGGPDSHTPEKKAMVLAFFDRHLLAARRRLRRIAA